MEKRIKNIKIVNKLFIISLLHLSLLVTYSTSILAEDVVEEILESKSSEVLSFKINQINPLNKIFYFSLDTSSSFALNNFKPSPIQLDIGIKHSLHNVWLLGFNVGFLNLKYDGKDLYNFKISQEISYPFNLYHPVYVLPGIRIGYGIPINKNFYFLDLNLDRNNFVFFSGFINFLYYYSSNYSFCFRIDLNHSMGKPKSHSFLSFGLGSIFSF